MTMPILVTGGTGTLGREVVPLLRQAGRDVRVLSRQSREGGNGVEHVVGDLSTGEGVAAALRGVGTVLHLAGRPKGDDAATRNLVRAATTTGAVEHLVAISVIGADRLPIGYFRMKAEVERVVAESGLQWTVLRAAQFHDLALKVAKGMGRSPVVPAPGGIRWEPVDARDVAARLVELTLGAPAGRVADLAGPEVHPLSDLVRGYLNASGKRRPMVPLRVPGKVGRAYRSGDNLAGDGADRGARSWEAFLAERLGQRVPAQSAA
jgi:uncharacterized protein YbjT (DUF2867 family)